MKIGVTARPTQSILEQAETARLIEDLGYQSAWIADHYFHRDASAALSLMLARTDTLVLGTAVMSPLLRHPALLASMAASLREIAPGRFVLGLGVGGYEFAGELNLPTPRPLQVTREAVQIVRELTAGTASVTGKTFSANGSRLRWAAAEGPLYLAARGPKMLELSGRIADGVITHGISPGHIAFVRDAVSRGAADEELPAAAASICLMLDVQIDDDREAALAALRPRCLTMAAGSYADELIDVYGLDLAEVTAARAALRRGDRGSAAALVTDRMASAFGLAGPAAEVAAGISALADLGVDEVIVSVGGADTDGYRHQLTALAQELIR